MKYMLDTNAWIWALDSPDQLPMQALTIIYDVENLPIGLSAISPWEVMKKESKGFLKLSLPIHQWIEHATHPLFISILPLSIEVALDSNHLPGEFHKDPADQIIVATARVHDLILITSDTRILRYLHVRTLWR